MSMKRSTIIEEDPNPAGFIRLLGFNSRWVGDPERRYETESTEVS